MGREKRKGRLNKGESNEFIGFGAFADATTANIPLPASDNTASKATKSIALTPVYLGSNSELSVLFPRIGQKRDAMTKTKALQDLQTFFSNPTEVKKTQADALAHFLYLYHTKLNYDDSPRVRSNALECCRQAILHVPKAFKNICQKEPELIGMILCSQADPATDVSKTSMRVVQAITLLDDVMAMANDGIWSFVERILCYSKPITMYQALFQKKSQEGKLSEKQEEEMDEKYVRIAGTAITGLQIYLTHQKGDISSPEDSRYLWRTLTSQKATLRRKTYDLLSTCCQYSQSLVDQDKISKVLLQNLSSEKEPSNVKILLETFLSFLASVPVDGRTALIANFSKALSKLFSKGCHGATQWSPTVLPIVAMLPANDQPGVLTSIWQGKSLLVGAADQLEVITAVAETSSFLLQKQSHELSEVVAKCWIQALQVFVRASIGNSRSGPSMIAYKQLGETLAKDLQNLDRAATTNPKSAMASLDDWFWNDEIPKALVFDAHADLGQLSALVRQFQPLKKYKHLYSVWKQLFHYNLQHCQAASGLVPSKELYQFWILLLERTSIDALFTNDERQHFLMNDLLRWMIIHTSSLSDQFSLELTKYDFELYNYVKYDGCWDPLLRELVSAKCDLEALVSGLRIVSQNSGVNSVKSKILCDLCNQVAKEAIIELHVEEHDDSGDDYSEATELNRHYHQKASDLLQTCVGLGEIDGVLVDGAVVEFWIKLACPDDHLKPRSMNPVLETLFALIKNEYFSQSTQKEKIILQIWRQGGQLWKESVLPWIIKNIRLCFTIIDAASTEQKSIMQKFMTSTDDNISWHWSEKSVRLLQMCPIKECPELGELPLASLDLLGLSEEAAWQLGNSFPSQSLMSIMEILDDLDDYDASAYRLQLFTNVKAKDPCGLLIEVLCTLSDGSTGVLNASKARGRRDKCATLLMKLGGKSLSVPFYTLLVDTCVKHLSQALTDHATPVICRGIAILSQLLSLQFKMLDFSKDLHAIGAHNKGSVKEGDALWYILDKNDLQKREACTVVKIHNDHPGEVYYTVRFQREGEILERQTIAERLYLTEATDSGASEKSIFVEEIKKEEKEKRQRLLGRVTSILSGATWSDWGANEYEIFNILTAQIGLFGKRGIGSIHYTIFQHFSSVQLQLIKTLNGLHSNEEFPAASLWSLALGLGYGKNTPSSSNKLTLSGFDLTALVQALVQVFTGDPKNDSENEKEGLVHENQSGLETNKERIRLGSPSLEPMRSTISFLTRVVPTLTDDSLREEAESILFIFVARCLENVKAEPKFTDDDYMALYAMKNITGGYEVPSELDAISAIVHAFASRWETSISSTWYVLAMPFAVINQIFKKKPKLAGEATRKHGNEVGKALMVASKRWFALELLHLYAGLERPIFGTPDSAMNEHTSRKVSKWAEKLSEEEIEELQEDCEFVCQWIPGSILHELESWQENQKKGYTVGEDVAYGRLLSWVAYLRIANKASTKDYLYRAAFNSYTRKTMAIDCILDLALAYADVSLDNRIKFANISNVDDVLVDCEEVELPKLAWLVLFRTIEIFPMLSKNWWETTCPNHFREAVREFVEGNVAPDLLKRELQRIKATSSFGEMTVKGSLISREVTALYTQDDFTLSVVIKLPPSFPFRRAEVDCSKTLGVPESRWKRWSLQITQALNNQGGSLTDALLLWKENVDKEFDGIEPCPVCYSVLHVKTHKLPEMECKTCQNRFHFDCLTQWFRSSGKNACVLCQQPWSGRRVRSVKT